MTVIDFFTQLTRTFYIVLFLLTLVDYLRHGGKIRRDIALVFLSLSATAMVASFRSVTGIDLPFLTLLGTLALIAQPFLLLRLFRYFQPVPLWIQRFALVGFMISEVLWVLFPTQTPPLVILAIVAYFVVVDGYAVNAFIRGAFASTGVVRHRLQFAAAGSALLAAVLFLAGIQIVAPVFRPLVLILNQILSMLSVIFFYLSFATPRWLRQGWQLAELRDYLLQHAQQPAKKVLVEILDQLCRSVTQAMGAHLAVVILWDEEKQQFVLQPTPEAAALSTVNLNDVDAIKGAWSDQKSTVVSTSTGLSGEAARMMEAAHTEMLLIAPIATTEHADGLLLVFLAHNSLFVDDDLSLLTIFAKETAIVLENNEVLQELHRHAEDLEQKVQERTAALQASEAELRAVFSAINDSIAVLDAKGRYLKIAPTRHSPLSKPSDELLGKTVYDVFPPTQADAFVNSIQLALTTQQTTNVEYNIADNGKNAWYIATMSPMLEDTILWVARDITTRKKTEEDLAHYALNLQRSNEELRQFAYVASHDLQEPLRMVGSYLQLIENRYTDKLDDEGREFIAYAVDGAARMKDLINGLLMYSRVETQPHNFTMISAQKALDEVCKLMAVSIDEAEAEITSDPLPQMRADERLIIQLFQNLVGNAIKYRSEQKLKIHVGVKRENNEWIFSVQDNGIGIEPQYLEKIFILFQRLHTRGKYSGTGIGLAICRKVVERHGGKIWAESEVGKGTTFYFTIPV